MRFRPSFRYLAAALLAVLLPIAVFGGAARAQTIDNTANASWVFDGTSYETESNLVTIDVETSDVFITVYRPTTGTGVPLDYRPALCSSTDFRGGTPAGGTRTATVQRTTVISAGDELFFEISAPLARISARQPSISSMRPSSAAPAIARPSRSTKLVRTPVFSWAPSSPTGFRRALSSRTAALG